LIGLKYSSDKLICLLRRRDLSSSILSSLIFSARFLLEASAHLRVVFLLIRPEFPQIYLPPFFPFSSFGFTHVSFVFAFGFRPFWLNFVFGDDQFAPCSAREKIVLPARPQIMSLIISYPNWGHC